MACCNSIVALAVMNGSPARANRHGGIAMASFVGGAPNAIGAPGPLALAEPCPYDSTGALLTSAYQTSYLAANGGNYPVDVLGNSFTASEVAFNIGECNLKPINPSQGQSACCPRSLRFSPPLTDLSRRARHLLSLRDLHWRHGRRRPAQFLLRAGPERHRGLLHPVAHPRQRQCVHVAPPGIPTAAD